MPGRNRQFRCRLASLASLILVTVAANSVTGQPNPQRQDVVASLGAIELATLVTRCGGPQPLEGSLDLVRRHGCSRRHSAAGEIVAFEENRWFVYALADMSSEPVAEDVNQAHQASRRILLLKPSTLVVEDVVRSPNSEPSVRWMLRSAAEPNIDASRFRVTAGDTEVFGETVLPADAALEKTTRPTRDDRPAGFRVEVTPKQASNDVRFIHVFHLGQNAGQGTPTQPEVVRKGKSMELTVAGPKRVFRLTLPEEGLAAGKIEITAADGTAIVPGRLLPSSVMPHGPKGAALMERWDAPYRREQMPGWDVGRPCSHLVRAVEDETFKPGRAIVLGCGTGTNAIFLASKGFDVTGIDVSPTALAIAAEKARDAEVEAEWILADVVSLPKLPSYDLIFDRGCYHHICQYDSHGYVETLRRLSHVGSRAMILAGSPADGNRGGPPRIKEETIRKDFSALFSFEWLRDVRFDSRNPDAKGTSAWSIHLRRKRE